MRFKLLAGALFVVLIVGIISLVSVESRAPSSGGSGYSIRTSIHQPLSPISKPNIILILTDDQDQESMRIRQPNGSLVMQHVNDLLVQSGTTFKNNVASFSLCCPSRATMLTGQYAHNHHVVSNTPPLGGFTALDHSNTLPIWLQQTGYRTIHIGKYLNGYDGVTIPPGWNDWYSPRDFPYYNYTLNENGSQVFYGNQPQHYSTNVFADKATQFIRNGSSDNTPFFMQFSVIAPHSVTMGLQPIPAPSDIGVMDAYYPVFSPAFNEVDMSDKPAIMQGFPPLSQSKINALVALERRRLESLLAVDRAVRDIVAALRETGKLENTYIIFTSDNGYLLGEHRLSSVKNHLYEESIQTPLVIRGPGVPSNRVRLENVANIDLAPTILDWSGATPGLPQDGRSLVPLLQNSFTQWRENVLIERHFPAFAGVRNSNYIYVEHDADSDGITDGVEFYNFFSDACHAADPYQLESQHANPCYSSIISQMQVVLQQLRACVGVQCG